MCVVRRWIDAICLTNYFLLLFKASWQITVLLQAVTTRRTFVHLILVKTQVNVKKAGELSYAIARKALEERIALKVRFISLTLCEFEYSVKYQENFFF